MLALVRIDDRLIHGQVVEGWLPVLRVDRVVVISDSAAADPTEATLMRLALPERVALDIVPKARAAEAVRGAAADARRAVVLAPGPAEILAALEGGAPVDAVNVGGMHFAAGRVQLGKAIFLSREDIRDLRAIAGKGVRLEGRAVPSETPSDVLALIRAKES